MDEVDSYIKLKSSIAVSHWFAPDLFVLICSDFVVVEVRYSVSQPILHPNSHICKCYTSLTCTLIPTSRYIDVAELLILAEESTEINQDFYLHQ
ncbi:hypothetical protein NIES4101_45220 [Calothrix sp. NIES-4101]|nr:hypothetical protein NIES4101_45220 [Calothrix sp. NIES-4101]